MRVIATVQSLLSRHAMTVSIISMLAIVGVVSGCQQEVVSPVSPHVDSVSLQAKNTSDIIPGWAMEFFDFEDEKEFKLSVVQRYPGEEGEVTAAAGVGRYVIGEARGQLIVTKASWSNWPNYPAGFPEDAPWVEGYARLVSGEWVFFIAQLISHGWPYTSEYDEAVLYIPAIGVTEWFTGELHHSRRRAFDEP